MSNKSSKYSSPTVDVLGFTGVELAEVDGMEDDEVDEGIRFVASGVDAAELEESGVLAADASLPVLPDPGVLCSDAIC